MERVNPLFVMDSIWSLACDITWRFARGQLWTECSQGHVPARSTTVLMRAPVDRVGKDIMVFERRPHSAPQVAHTATAGPVLKPNADCVVEPRPAIPGPSVRSISLTQ
eukprot:2687517-Amphidinium_carterae.1